MTGSQPDSADVGDRVIAVDNLEVGDLACFQAVAPGVIAIRKLDSASIESFPGNVYRVEVGSTPSSRTFTCIRGPVMRHAV